MAELRSLRDGWYNGKGWAPSIHALSVLKRLLTEYLSVGPFEITPQLDGSICLKTQLLDYVHPERYHSITCTIEEDGSLRLQLVGIPQHICREGRDVYLPHELREGAKFLNNIHY